ncbi:hypothetical protein A6E13_16410 [Aliivibrio fischeri]|uniref:hypothetical protein n=1 Tax=Aliivibrio fischeri TaxID=668 RepID=UPI00080EC65D|nr:hypothetical protein [Aliivibrio fischeri]OCH31805.1 hypothetical protein A6E13_16410 [Aliivibrio fischeri]
MNNDTDIANDVKTLADKFVPKREIQTMLNLTTRELDKIAIKNDIEFKGNKRWDEEDSERLAQMAFDGYTLKEAAKELGRNYFQTAAYASRHKIKFAGSKTRRWKKKEKESFNISMHANLLNAAL